MSIPELISHLRSVRDQVRNIHHMVQDEDYCGPIPQWNVDMVCHAKPYHDRHLEYINSVAEDLTAMLLKIEAERNAKQTIKECPFCGGRGIANLSADQPYIYCESCDIHGPGYDTFDEAMAAWNRRSYNDELTHTDIYDRLAGIIQATDQYQELATHIGGCGDGGCIVLRPIGQHTNGGCRCLSGYNAEDNMNARRLIIKAQHVIRTILKQPKVKDDGKGSKGTSRKR